MEITKSFFPDILTVKENVNEEARRQRYINLLAVVCGLITSALAQTQIPIEILPTNASDAQRFWTIASLGLLASGGSGLWNSILTYVVKIKDLKGAEAKKENALADIASTQK